MELQSRVCEIHFIICKIQFSSIYTPQFRVCELHFVIYKVQFSSEIINYSSEYVKCISFHAKWGSWYTVCEKQLRVCEIGFIVVQCMWNRVQSISEIHIIVFKIQFRECEIQFSDSHERHVSCDCLRTSVINVFLVHLSDWAVNGLPVHLLHFSELTYFAPYVSKCFCLSSPIQCSHVGPLCVHVWISVSEWWFKSYSIWPMNLKLGTQQQRLGGWRNLINFVAAILDFKVTEVKVIGWSKLLV